MRSPRRIWAVVAIALSACLAPAVADAGVVSRVGGGGNVTLSIYQQTSNTFADVTDSYLPTWAPGAARQTVYVVVNGGGTPSLVQDIPAATGPNPFLTSLTTSRFPGNCTNWGTETASPAALDFDFSQSGTPITLANGTQVTGYALTANDCGGMAVIAVGTDKFVVPKDTDLNGRPTGVPDALDVFGVALTPDGDPDGDGLSTFDETVRGFIIGGQHVRLNPTAKDVFVFLVRGQCGPTLLKTGGFPTTTPNAGSLDANLVTLLPRAAVQPVGISPSQIHFLGNSLTGGTAIQTDEWTDHFVGFSLGSNGATETWTYCNSQVAAGTSCAAGNTVTVTAATSSPAAPATDRVVTKNQVYPNASLLPMKGLRLTECATTSGTAPNGTGRYGTGAAQGKDEAIVYTDRIRRFVNSIGRSSADVYYSTFQNGAWSAPAKQNSTTVTTQQARDFIASKIVQYVIAMEIGHTLKLISDSLLATVPTFPHYAAGYGDTMDDAIQAITSGSPSGVKFYIPKAFQGASQGSLQLTAPAAIPIQ